MIDYIKNNYLWIGSVIVPILIAIIGGIIKLFMKSGRNQKVGDVNGNGNVIINGDVTEHSKKTKKKNTITDKNRHRLLATEIRQE